MEEKYRHLIRDGYEFEFAKYFSEGWDLFKKGAGSYIGFLLVTGLIMGAVGLIFWMVFGSLFFFSIDSASGPDMSGMVPGLIIFYILYIVVLTLVQYCMYGGFYIYSGQLITKSEDFGQFFKGFKFIKEIAAFFLFYLLIVSPIIILIFTTVFPLEMFLNMFSGDFYESQYMMEDYAESMGARIPLMFLLYLLLAAVLIAYSLTLPLIVDAGLPAWKAMETSRKVVSKKFFHFLGLYIVAGLMMMIGGLITCYLGFLVLIPYFLCIHFMAYNRIFKPQRAGIDAQIDEFGENEDDTNTEAEEKN